MSLTLFCRIYFELETYFTLWTRVSIVDFEQVPVNGEYLSITCNYNICILYHISNNIAVSKYNINVLTMKVILLFNFFYKKRPTQLQARLNVFNSFSSSISKVSPHSFHFSFQVKMYHPPTQSYLGKLIFAFMKRGIQAMPISCMLHECSCNLHIMFKVTVHCISHINTNTVHLITTTNLSKLVVTLGSSRC